MRLSFIQGNAFECRCIFAVDGRNIQVHAFDLHVVKAAAQQRTDWSSHRTCSHSAEFPAEKRRSSSIASCPRTLMAPLIVIVESPRARSLEVIVLKTVRFSSSGVRKESFAIS